LPRTLELKYCSAHPGAVKAKSQVRTVNTQLKAENGNYADNIISGTTYSNKLKFRRTKRM